MTDLTTRLAELKAVAEKATPGPWHLGGRWHIQGAEFCTCAEMYGPLIREQLMDINGEMMLAHVHESAQPWYPHGIMTEPWEDGHPRSVVNTTSEYGHPAREDEEHIATFDPPTVLALIAALEAVLALHYPEPFHDEPSKSFCVADQRTAGVWPCPTIRAITEALGIEATND